MPHPRPAAARPPGPRAAGAGVALRAWRVGVAWLLLVVLAVLLAVPARAQGVQVLSFELQPTADAVVLDYQLRVSLPRAAEEAVQRGVPLYFKAQATLWRNRWYWRDERVARVSREWRLSWQPLTATWRVSQGGLAQTHASLAEALIGITSSAGWKVADLGALDRDSRYYLEFAWLLDTAQLPRPMQIGLSGPGTSSEWALSVEREVKLRLDADK